MKEPTINSRQRRWQVRKRALGLCVRCGQPSDGRSECDACARRIGTKKRHPLKSAWEKIDWSLPDAVIAAALGVGLSAPLYHRKKLAAAGPSKS